MISTIITQILYVLLIIFLATFIIRLFYIFYKISFVKIKSFFGVIIEGSEIYWRWRWKKLHREGKFVYQNLDKHHPERGWTLIPNLKNKLHYAAEINSNSEGIRGSREKYSGKKVLFFGDSFCFGEGVDDNETIPYFFEKNFNNISSLNLGIHGYGLDQQYLYLKETISKYKPAVLCFIITDNDIRRNSMDFRDFAKPKFIFRNNKIVLKNSSIPKPEELRIRKPSIKKLLGEFVKNFFIFYGIIDKKKRTKINNFILDSIREEAKKNNSELFFVYISDPRRGLWYRTSYMTKYFINYVKKNKVDYLFLEEIFGKEKMVQMFDTLSGHFTTQGNKSVAEELSKMIKLKGALK